MLAINSEIFPLSVSPSELDIPNARVVHLCPYNSYIDYVWDQIYHDIHNGAITNLSHPHELTPLEQHIYVASTKIDVGGMERGTLYKCQTNMSMLTISYPFMSDVKCLDVSAVKVWK